MSDLPEFCAGVQLSLDEPAAALKPKPRAAYSTTHGAISTASEAAGGG